MNTKTVTLTSAQGIKAEMRKHAKLMQLNMNKELMPKFVDAIIESFVRNPKIMLTMEKMSEAEVMILLKNIASSGLVPDGINAVLIPFGGKTPKIELLFTVVGLQRRVYEWGNENNYNVFFDVGIVRKEDKEKFFIKKHVGLTSADDAYSIDCNFSPFGEFTTQNIAGAYAVLTLKPQGDDDLRNEIRFPPEFVEWERIKPFADRGGVWKTSLKPMIEKFIIKRVIRKNRAFFMAKRNSETLLNMIDIDNLNEADSAIIFDGEAADTDIQQPASSPKKGANGVQENKKKLPNPQDKKKKTPPEPEVSEVNPPPMPEDEAEYPQKQEGFGGTGNFAEEADEEPPV